MYIQNGILEQDQNAHLELQLTCCNADTAINISDSKAAIRYPEHLYFGFQQPNLFSFQEN